MAEAPLRVLIDHLVFPECPRWHDGCLWFSDMYDRRVWRATEDGQTELVVEVQHQPAGLGWLPDRSLLVVSMTDRRLLRLDGDELVEVADLTPYASFHCNDMVVDENGRAYVGNFGFDFDGGAEPTGTTLVCVEPDGEAWVVVEQLLFPNGCVITPDGSALIVAESYGQRLSAYDMNEDGSLSNPRIWADLRPNVPDGICIDAESGVWVADPVNRGVIRVVEGKGAVDWVSTGERRPYACALGGSDGHTLFVCTADSSNPAKAIELRVGRIEVTRVETPMVGYVAPDDDESESEAA